MVHIGSLSYTFTEDDEDYLSVRYYQIIVKSGQNRIRITYLEIFTSPLAGNLVISFNIAKAFNMIVNFTPARRMF